MANPTQPQWGKLCGYPLVLIACFYGLAGIDYAGQSTWPNGYSYAGTITVSHSEVPNSDQANFPVLISGTYPALATTAHGGHVSGSNGYDIIFTSDSAGNNKLPFERVSYSATGKVTFWVQVPLVSHTNDTVFYIFYGNSAVGSDPSNSAGTWDGNYAAVLHLAHGSTVSASDSSSNHLKGTLSNITAASGEFATAANFNGRSSNISFENNVSALEPSTAVTVSAWVKPGSNPENSYANIVDYDYSSPRGYPYVSYKLSPNDVNGFSNNYEFELSTSGNGDNAVYSGVSPTAGTWAYVVGTYDGTTQKIYVNGVLKGQAGASGNILYSNGNFVLGANGDLDQELWNGLAQEVRVSKTARTADWIAAEYHNQSNPSSFYSAVWGQTAGSAASTSSTSAASVAATSVTTTSTVSTLAAAAANKTTTDSASAPGPAPASSTKTTSSASSSSSSSSLSSTSSSSPSSSTPSTSLSTTSSTAATPAVTAAPAQLSASSTSLAFGSVNGGNSGTKTVMLTNSGGSILSISQVNVSGLGLSATGIATPASLAPGQTTVLSLVYTPADAAALSGTVTLVSNASNSSLAISVTGTGVQPQLSVTPSSISFGSVNVGSAAAHTVTISNSGNSSLTITQSSISGNAYSVSGLSLPLTLAPGQSSSFSVEFTPQSGGTPTGSVVLSSNSPNPSSITLSGTGVAPVTHSVTLTWSPSISAVTGYNVYVGTVSGGPYVELTSTPVTGTSFTDTSVQAGQTYYFVVTSVDGGVESSDSSEVAVSVP